MEEIRKTLSLAAERDRFSIEARGAVRSEDLHQYFLDVKPQIVHFSGHGGGEEGLAFEDEMGSLKVVENEDLLELFRLFAKDIYCVVLNACYAEMIC